MELKSALAKMQACKVSGSNRTFMELKLPLHRNQETTRLRSNRTFMELKYIGINH